MWYYQGKFFMGRAHAVQRDSGGLFMMEESIERFRQANEFVLLSLFCGVLANCYQLHDEFERSKKWLDTGLNHVEAPLLRLKGRHLICSCDAVMNETLDMIRHANYIALTQEAISWVISEHIKKCRISCFSLDYIQR